MAADTFAIIATQLVTVLGILYYLGQRIDCSESSLGQRMDSLGRDLRGELAELRREQATTRAELSARIDPLSGRLDVHIERHAG